MKAVKTILKKETIGKFKTKLYIKSSKELMTIRQLFLVKDLNLVRCYNIIKTFKGYYLVETFNAYKIETFGEICSIIVEQQRILTNN